MSTATWLTTSKPTFLTEMLALPAKEAKQVLEKIALLSQDPTPDAKVKKLLKYIGQHQVCRLRSGHYRVFYTYKHPYVTLLGLRRRDDDTYDAEIEPEDLGGGDVQIDLPIEPEAREMRRPKPGAAPHPVDPVAAQPHRPLPTPITAALLCDLRIPEQWHPCLQAVATEEDLLACGVLDEYLLRLMDALFERPLAQVLAQPDYLTPVEDLLRYKDGDLLGFLLRLGPEQERLVGWALNASGPTLVKGGPGTGKSTIALYRVRAMIEALRAAGIAHPRILFTTYTKALIAYSEQLLGSLLGDDARCVSVRNVDKLVIEHAGPTIRGCAVATSDQCRQVLDEALRATTYAGSVAEQHAQRQCVAALSPQYLLEEFDAMIEARCISTLDAYLAVARPGRSVRLGTTQRRAVWAVYRTFSVLLERRKLLTWGGVRRRAAQVARGMASQGQYDAVVVDEAQDLDPNCLRLLVALCRTANRLFLTADANQSIYGGGFRWAEVHDALRFRGRTGLLKVNFRTTRQIGQAAQAYLSDGGIDDDPAEPEYRTEGPLPLLRIVESVRQETEVLADFVRRSLLEMRLGLGSCAVLVPSEQAGKAIASRLSAAGLEALHMPGSLLDLKRPCIKVITLKSAKGLEFPVVALAGFRDGPYPFIPTGAAEDERAELLGRERRTLFVGITRAMRHLLVAVPAGSASPLFQPLGGPLWDAFRPEEDG